MRAFLVLFFYSIAALGFASAQNQKDSLLSIMEEELTREMHEFSKASKPPYYIDYRIHDLQTSYISASLGSLNRSNTDHTRFLNTRVKVGDYQLDNTHALPEGRNDYYGAVNNSIAIDNNADAIKYTLWQSTQTEYKRALQRYKEVQSKEDLNKDKSVIPDYAKEAALKNLAPIIEQPTFNPTAWEQKAKEFSKLFLNVADLMSNDVTFQIIHERKYFASSEGTSLVQNFEYVYINISASVHLPDNDLIPLHRTFFAPTLSQLPKDQVIIDEIKSMIALLEALKKAPLAEPYTGPALLDSRAAGVFFHEIFGHRVEGHRLKSDQDGQTFKTKIGEQVLPESMNLFFDPTRDQFEGHYLNGVYSYDDEGVKARKVNVVEKGILKTFLMSRSPLENLPNSNGHGRASAGSSPVSRQSNLFVETSKPKSDAELRQMLMKECKKQEKKYGYLFKDVIGGFTLTGRFTPNAFNIFPTEVYRVYVDGRPDELVRGVDLIGTPLAMFAEIIAAGNHSDVFTGFCGAESGYVPVSAISPSLFVRRIETQKKPKSNVEDPLLPSPVSKQNNND